MRNYTAASKQRQHALPSGNVHDLNQLTSAEESLVLLAASAAAVAAAVACVIRLVPWEPMAPLLLMTLPTEPVLDALSAMGACTVFSRDALASLGTSMTLYSCTAASGVPQA